MNNKVVYGWFHGSELFYVGMGSRERAYHKRSRNIYCSRKRAKAEKDNTFQVEILYENLSQEQACEIECQLIQQFGRKDLGTGCLTNMSIGGEGNTYWQGKSRSDIDKHKISQSQLNNTQKTSKSVVTPLGEFRSIRQAAISHNITRKGLIWRIDHKEGYFYK